MVSQIKNEVIRSIVWAANTLTILIIGIYIFKSLKDKTKNYIVTVTLIFNFFCILYPIFEFILCNIPEDHPWETKISVFQNIAYHLTINWATALAVFTYGVLNASGPYPFKAFIFWSMIASIALSIFSSYVIDVKWSDKIWADYFHFGADGIMSIIQLLIIYRSYTKAYELITSWKLGFSLYANTNASRMLWYARITIICHAPNIITDILVIIRMMLRMNSKDFLPWFFEYNPTRIFYCSWALLNFWVDWSVMRVYRERAVTRISYRMSKAMSMLSDDNQEFEICYDEL